MQEIWYGDRTPGLLLRAMERVYGQLAARRQQQRQPAPDLRDQPIVVVGNLTAGGTGKTPLTIRLCQLARQVGLQVAVISRGYGRSGSGPITVNADSEVSSCGDEPLLIARQAGVNVFVDSDREAAARRALASGAELIIADDGLQRRSLPRQLELCVLDGARGFGNERLLPAGPLREPLTRLESVDALISNGEWQGGSLPQTPVTMSLEPVGWYALGTEEPLSILELQEQLAGGPVHALAGIGNPQRFFDTLSALGIEVDHAHAFADHERYEASHFEAMEGTLLMTEKDAMKCEQLTLPPSYALRVEARLPAAWEQNMSQRLLALSQGRPSL